MPKKNKKGPWAGIWFQVQKIRYQSCSICECEEVEVLDAENQFDAMGCEENVYRENVVSTICSLTPESGLFTSVSGIFVLIFRQVRGIILMQ